MKAIKIILGIISTVAVVFFSTGLIVKETSYSTQVKIEKPIADVFTLFNDPSKLKEWIPEFKSIDTLEEKPGKTGSTYKIIIKNNGQEIVMNEKILAFVPNEKVTLFYKVGNMLKTDDYVFTSDGEFTIITNKSTCKSDKYLLSCVFPYFKSKFKEQNLAYLNNFKALIEKQ
ncbi:hypothetical protein C7447_103280 [Tenacibaculum adriaticum]|uniref:Polyketide cyclase/dehydrase/lipid transport protein n=1 Tax=Tenacibaculum adriaticum TaxID=413713 RepID=A0A5S5DQ80_9FLAO|nr:SRPBCC family protein [Tenacibaculum adriaticum]TYP98110.1 hypothetical protein C7447_103280 [Tenacibaculum adriaticum]